MFPLSIFTGCARAVNIWMLQINQDARIMEGSRTKAEKSGTAIKSAARFRYETGKTGAWGKLYVRPHASTKGGEKKADAILMHIHHK